MANRWAILPAATTSVWSSTGTWSASDGGATGASVPTSADAVIVNANSVAGAAAILSIDGASTCLSMNWTGATNTPQLSFVGSNTLTIATDLTLIAAMTMGGSQRLVMSGAGGTITSNGFVLSTLYTMTISAGTFTLADAFNAGANAVILSGGGLDTNDQAVTAAITISGAGAKTLDLGASVINTTAWNYSGSNLTLTEGTSSIRVTGTGTFAGGGETYNDVQLNGTAHTVSGSNTFTTLTRTGTATKTDTVTFTSGTTQTTTTCAMIGNSSTNRLLVQSSTLGTAATITATNWTGTVNVDITDITATNAIDLSAITGLSGDCQGNTGITFTTTAAQISNANGNFSTLATWQDGAGTDRVPLPQDDWSCSHDLTIDMPRIGKSITFTGTPTVTLGNIISVYGSLTLVSGMTWTHSNYGTFLCGRGAYTLTTAGKNLFYIYVIAPDGSVTLQDDLSLTADLSLYNGTLDFNDNNVTTRGFSNNGYGTRILTMGSGTFTLSGTGAGTKWNTQISGFTQNAETSTVVLTNSGVNAQSLVGGGATFNHVRVEGAGNYALTFTGNNTIGTLTIDRSAAAKTIAGAVSTTITNLVIPISGTTVVTITDMDFVKTSSRLALDYLDISGSAASGGASFYAGSRSTDSGSNSGWWFRNPEGAYK